MSAFDRLSRMCGPVPPPELLAELAAHRAEVVREVAAELWSKTLLADDCACVELVRAMASPAAAPVPVKTAGELRGRALLDAKTVADAEATHWRRLGITPDAGAETGEVERLRAELAQAIEHRNYWHAELMHADARIAELGAKQHKGGGSR